MTEVTILGAGAFGFALAATLGQKHVVHLWGRNLRSRETPRLPGVTLGPDVRICDALPRITADSTVLLTVPAQSLSAFLAEHAPALNGARLVACCKGVDLKTGLGATGLIAHALPAAQPAILTGPSFATDIARGLPTALTLACRDADLGTTLREQLSTRTLRIYSTTDVVGAELGGALKNVIAIAAGVTIGAGLGDSARAAVMTRGYSEMLRLSVCLGAQAETLAGLSGLGDLVLTCTSDHSRNFRHGLSLGRGVAPDTSATVEGIATAQAICDVAAQHGVAMPISTMVAALTRGEIALQDAIQSLLSRPLKPE